MWTAKRYSWRGVTKRKLQGLAPGEDRTIEMEAAVFGSGIVELGDYRLLWAVEGPQGKAGAIEGEPFIVDIRDDAAAAALGPALASLSVCQ